MNQRLLILFCAFCSSVLLAETKVDPGTRLRYVAISTKTEAKPPVSTVDFIYGPEEKGNRWWELDVRTGSDDAATPVCIIRACTTSDPLVQKRQPIHFRHYQVRIPATGEALEYIEKHSGDALLPAWVDFEKYFVPVPMAAAEKQNGAPRTCAYLGHVLSLKSVTHNAGWTNWTDVKRLELDREVLVGTGRNFKDAEGKRLPQTPQRTEYTYVPFKQEDYRTMFDAGMNLFMVDGNQEQWVRDEPVFYVVTRTTPAQFPTDCYRANFIGTSMFMDEPASILTWDQPAQGKIKYFSDAVTLIEKRTRLDDERQPYGRSWLESLLTSAGVNFGDMRLGQSECPVWETFYDRAYYVLKGGGSGIVHEGRYDLQKFNNAIASSDDKKRPFTMKQMLRYHYAFLRGAALATGKQWGTAIYGQCDTNAAPQAFTQAYDMGARYFWFWTSDHDHHVPWPEQLELSRKLKQYAREHPRASIFELPPRGKTAIVVPNGYFISIDWMGWLHSLDDKNSDDAKRYHRLMQQALDEVHKCFDRGEDFDFTVDDGRPITRYRRIVRLNLD